MEKALQQVEVTLEAFRADVAGITARSRLEGPITVVDAKGRMVYQIVVQRKPKG